VGSRVRLGLAVGGNTIVLRVLVEATQTDALACVADTVVCGVFAGESFAHDVASGALGALLARGEARTRLGHVAVTHDGERRLIAVGLGERERFDAERARVAAARAYERSVQLGTHTLAIEVPHRVGEEVVAGLVQGALLRSYRFERFRPARDDGDDDGDQEAAAQVARLLISAHDDVGAAVSRAAVITEAQNRARELGDTPANVLTPSALARYCEDAAEGLDGLSVTVLAEGQLRKAGMGAFAAVAQGSREQARLIRIDYEGPGADPRRSPLGLIGKGLTFDSGGLSLKPAASMQEMKFDMCGAAAVIEAVCALAHLRAPVRAMAVVGAAENMPGGGAVRPGDIVTALDGTTIEINNTDAEGRLVLADCIAYAIEHGARPLLDLATLTGGAVIALGSFHGALMSNDEELAGRVQAAAGRAGEPVWRLPLHERYAEMIRGRYAQLTNLTERREASAITAAQLLAHFARQVPWAHLDIAGTAYDVPLPYFHGKGATGFGVRLAVELALDVGS
jgi:leucyl aminopeptidase